MQIWEWVLGAAGFFVLLLIVAANVIIVISFIQWLIKTFRAKKAIKATTTDGDLLDAAEEHAGILYGDNIGSSNRANAFVAGAKFALAFRKSNANRI